MSALGAGVLSNSYGRKATMTLGGLCFIAGSLLQASAPSVACLVVGRILLGVGIGAANQASCVYCILSFPVLQSARTPTPQACRSLK